jgi:hypothetical protein
MIYEHLTVKPTREDDAGYPMYLTLAPPSVQILATFQQIDMEARGVLDPRLAEMKSEMEWRGDEGWMGN